MDTEAPSVACRVHGVGRAVRGGGTEETMRIRTTTIVFGALTLAIAACSKNESRPAAYGTDNTSARTDAYPTHPSSQSTTARNERENTVGVPNESSTREPTAGTDTLSKIVEARCSREARCNNVGANEKYSSTADCDMKVRDDWRQELDSRSCSQGVDNDALDICLRKIREDSCNSPTQSLSRWMDCRQGKICKG
jgi:hypothetical protein